MFKKISVIMLALVFFISLASAGTMTNNTKGKGNTVAKQAAQKIENKETKKGTKENKKNKQHKKAKKGSTIKSYK